MGSTYCHEAYIDENGTHLHHIKITKYNTVSCTSVMIYLNIIYYINTTRKISCNLRCTLNGLLSLDCIINLDDGLSATNLFNKLTKPALTMTTMGIYHSMIRSLDGIISGTTGLTLVIYFLLYGSLSSLYGNIVCTKWNNRLIN